MLAFNGLGKVLRAHMATVLALPGFNDKWDETSKTASMALISGRKSVAVAAAQLLSGFLQASRDMLWGLGLLDDRLYQHLETAAQQPQWIDCSQYISTDA